MEGDEQFDMQAEDGLFFMNFKSFRTVFDRIFIAQNFPDDWWCVRYESQWDETCSGGLPSEGNDAAFIRYATNPQYLIQPMEEDIELFVSLGQNDGRLKGEDGTYCKYPFKERLVAGHLAIWELGPGETQLKKYETKQLHAKNGPVRASSNAVRTKLKKGRSYVIVPSAIKNGTCGEFYLSLYLSCHLHYVNIERIGKPTERYSFIQEEFEKASRQILPWKVDWVKEQVKNKNIITKTDAGSKSLNVTKASFGKSRRTPTPMLE